MTSDRTVRGTMTSTTPTPPPPDESMDEHVVDESVESDAGQDTSGIGRYEIGFYGADYPIDALYKRMIPEADGSAGDIIVPPFQRRYVWTKAQADRFIESLLLGLPVPGIFLSSDSDTKKLIVIDGLQRLLTIKHFVDGATPLGNGIHEEFRGKSYESLNPSDRREFDNAIIHATVIRQDKPEDDSSSLYHVFERLNTGGTPAQPHEVRRSLYGGALNNLLEELDQNEDWREVYGRPSKRLKDQELILRFIALREAGEQYGNPDKTMKDFLTSYMKSHRDISRDEAERIAKIFSRTIGFVNSVLGKSAFRPEGRLNTAVFDAVMVGISNHLNSLEPDSLKLAYQELINNSEFINATTSRTSHEPAVRKRIVLAQNAFNHAGSA